VAQEQDVINFKMSSGGTVSNPTPEFVRHSLFDDPAAWSSTPDVLLTSSIDGRSRKLLIAYAPKLGYYIQYIDGRSLWILVPSPADIEKQVVEIDEDYQVAKGLLCDQDTAWSAVRWFLEKDDKCPSLNWLSDHKLPNGVVF
jgi:hypothetical protein